MRESDLIRRVLRTAATLLIRAGYTLDYFKRLSDEVFTEAAIEEIERQGLKAKVEYVAARLQTTRSKARRLIEGIGSVDEVEARWDSRIIAGWRNDPAYRASGNPMPLPFSSADGPSFEGLVAAYGRGKRATTYLALMMSMGLIEPDPEDEKAIRLANLDPAGTPEAQDAGNVRIAQAILFEGQLHGLSHNTTCAPSTRWPLRNHRNWLKAEHLHDFRGEVSDIMDRARAEIREAAEKYESQDPREGVEVGIGLHYWQNQ